MLPGARRRRDGAGARARRPDSPRGDRGRARRTCAAATARRHDRPPRWGAPRGIFHGDPSSPRRLTAQMCGIIGVTGIPDAARLAYLGLYSLQHRGQESAGIVAVDGAGVARSHRGMGLVSDIFAEPVLAGLEGDVAVGHTRYSTAGSSGLAHPPPMLSRSPQGPPPPPPNGALPND